MIPSITARSPLRVARRPAASERTWADPDRHRRRSVARPVLVARARVRAAAARCEPGQPSPRAATGRGRAAVGARAGSRCRARPSMFAWGRSASARSIGSCATGWTSRSRARRCSASTSGRAAIRSSRSSWPAFSTRTSTRFSRSRFPRRSKSSCARGSPELPAATREALALASALGTPSESVLLSGRVLRRTRSTPAVAAQVIERENGTIRFTHPLLSSVLYQDLGEERRGVHGRIAGIVDDPLLRARHLALSTDVAGRGASRRARRRCAARRPIAARRRSRPSSPSRRSG